MKRTKASERSLIHSAAAAEKAAPAPALTKMVANSNRCVVCLARDAGKPLLLIMKLLPTESEALPPGRIARIRPTATA